MEYLTIVYCLEKWIWMICLITLMGFAVNIVLQTILHFMERPTYIVKLEKIRTVMAFPLLQVCPEVNFPEQKMEAFLAKIRFPHYLNITYIRSILRQLSAFYSPDVKYNRHDLEWIQHLLDYNEIDVYSASLQMTLSCKETLLKCRWQGIMFECQHLFSMEMTSYGFCCVFNGRSLRKEIVKYGIHKVKPIIKYYTRSIGFSSGLIVAVNQSTVSVDIDLSYKWVAIDGGQNYVEANINGTPLSPGVELWMGHINKGFHLTEDAKDLDTTLRGCRLTGEGLKLFPVYHKKYCQLECRIRHYRRACDCALLTFPVPHNVPYCRASQMDCIKWISKRFSQDKCGCTHTCDVDTDHVELSSFDLATSGGVLDTFYDDLDFSKTSVVRVFIVKRDVKTSSRRAFYTQMDLFAQLGGVFNLFFGCSIISLLELLQLSWHYFKNRRTIAQNKKHNIGKKNKKENIKSNKVRTINLRLRPIVYEDDKRHKAVKKVRFQVK